MGRNVFELLSKLPRHGVGAKLMRGSWKEGSFWTVTDVRLSLDGGHGQAWGQLTWGGVPQGEQPRQINGPLKRVWRVVDAPAGAAARGPVAWESLAAQALREESAAAAAEAAAAEEAAALAAEQPADAST